MPQQNAPQHPIFSGQKSSLQGRRVSKLTASSTQAMTRIAETSTKFMHQAEKSFQVQGAAIQNLENQIGQIAKALLKRQRWTLPFIVTNPKQ